MQAQSVHDLEKRRNLFLVGCWPKGESMFASAPIYSAHDLLIQLGVSLWLAYMPNERCELASWLLMY